MAIAGTRALVIVTDTNVVASNSLTGVGSALNDVDLDRLIVLIVGKYIGDRGSRDQGDEKSANGHRRDAHDIASSRGGWRGAAIAITNQETQQPTTTTALIAW